MLQVLIFLLRKLHNSGKYSIYRGMVVVFSIALWVFCSLVNSSQPQCWINGCLIGTEQYELLKRYCFVAELVHWTAQVLPQPYRAHSCICGTFTQKLHSSQLTLQVSQTAQFQQPMSTLITPGCLIRCHSRPIIATASVGCFVWGRKSNIWVVSATNPLVSS